MILLKNDDDFNETFSRAYDDWVAGRVAFHTVELLPYEVLNALRYNISVYDAAYLGATEELGAPAYTADERLSPRSAGAPSMTSPSTHPKGRSTMLGAHSRGRRP